MTRREWIALSLAAPASAASVSVKDIQTALKLSMAGDASRSLAAKITAQRKSPLIDGRSVAFVLDNAKPAAVTGPAARLGRIPMRRLPGTSVQVAVIEVERDQKVPYTFEIDGATVPDPWNPDSAVTMPDYHAPKEASGSPSQHGEQRRFDEILVSAPKRSEPLPIIIVLDGQLYLDAGLPQIAAAVKIPPVLLAMAPAAADPKAVLSRISKEIRVKDAAADHCVMGSGTAGFRAFDAAWQAPDVFGRVLAQSAQFPERDYPDMIRSSPAKPITGFLSAGRNDPPAVVDANHLVWGALRQNKYSIVCREDEGFACIFSWQRLLPAALAHVWGG